MGMKKQRANLRFFFNILLSQSSHFLNDNTLVKKSDFSEFFVLLYGVVDSK